MKVIFITVAGQGIGLGHLLRSRVLLNEMALKGWETELLYIGPVDILERWSWNQSIKQQHIGTTITDDELHNIISIKLLNKDVNWLVIDGYQFRGASWAEQVNTAGGKLLVIDDIGDKYFIADAVLNQNGMTELQYSTNGIHALNWFLGPKYSLVDPEYCKVENKVISKKIKRVLIVFGGADRLQLTPKLVSLLLKYNSEIELEVVIGPYNKWDNPPLDNPRLNFYIAPSGLADLMHKADLVITSAGSTVWQVCAAGCPAIIIQTVDNQAEIVATLAKSRAAMLVDVNMIEKQIPKILSKLTSEEERKSLILRARALVDGAGASRVADKLKALSR